MSFLRHCIAASLLLAVPLQAQSAVDRVDPFIGTGGEGHTFPGAVAADANPTFRLRIIAAVDNIQLEWTPLPAVAA